MCPCGVSHGQLGASGLAVLRADYQQPWARFLLDLGKATAGILSKPRPSRNGLRSMMPLATRKSKSKSSLEETFPVHILRPPTDKLSNKFIIQDHQTQQKASHYESSLAETKNPMHSDLQECQIYFEIVRYRVQNS